MNPFEAYGELLEVEATIDKSRVTLTIEYPPLAAVPNAVGLTAMAASTNTQAGTLGQAQVESAEVEGTVTGTGDVEVVVTSDLFTAPVVLAVPVLENDLASEVGTKIHTFITEDESAEEILEHFTLSGELADIVLTAKVNAANDETLNISIDNGTCTGLTTKATSTNTTAGIAPALQIETGAVVADITAEGLILVKVTATIPDWTAEEVYVWVDEEDDAEAVATAIVTELEKLTALTAVYDVSKSTSNVILTAKAAAANDAALKMEWDIVDFMGTAEFNFGISAAFPTDTTVDIYKDGELITEGAALAGTDFLLGTLLGVDAAELVEDLDAKAEVTEVWELQFLFADPAEAISVDAREVQSAKTWQYISAYKFQDLLDLTFGEFRDDISLLWEEAFTFGELVFEVDEPTLASILPTGKLLAVASGEIVVTVKVAGNETVEDTVTIEIVGLDSYITGAQVIAWIASLDAKIQERFEEEQVKRRIEIEDTDVALMTAQLALVCSVV